MILTYDADRQQYRLYTTYAEREAPKTAGFRWDPERKQWWTTSPDRAAGLAQHADESCRRQLTLLAETQSVTREASRAVTADIEIPAPKGLVYLPFQRAGIAFASSRPATLIADEMGLGKTIEALGLINLDPTIERILVVCPATLKLNWVRETRRWVTRPMSIGIAEARLWPRTQMIVVNFDVVHKHAAVIRERPWDLLIVDECHYLKTPSTRRTTYVLGTDDRTRRRLLQQGRESEAITPIVARRRLFLTGTPIVNRPIELWPLIHSLDPERWPSFWTYARRYTDAHQNGYGWQLGGASHLDELQDRLRSTIMVRRLKKNVLTELPPKRRQVLEITPEGTARVRVQHEQRAWAAQQERLVTLRAAVELAKASEDPADYEAAVAALRDGERVAFTEMSRLRHETAVAKIPAVIDHLRLATEEGESKVVVFVHHHDVVHALAAAFPDQCAVLTGETPMAARLAEVDRFQTDPRCQVFIGSITAAGIGITLTASSHVIFAELDWVPGNLTQAEDRCHRIGQASSVLVQHLVLEGSLDAEMARRLIEKQKVIDAALDKTPAAPSAVPAVPETEAELPATRSTKREHLEALASTLTPDQIVAIHRGLQMLAGRCDGALKLDGAGFNKLDTVIGHSLADVPRLTPKQAALGRSLVNRYRRQLPDDVLTVSLVTVEPRQPNP